MAGKFIVFEGGEGSGKSALMERLRPYLPVDAVLTRNPGGTPIGEKIRALALSKDLENVDPKSELLLFLAGRAQLVADVIKPALDKGRVVICDRYELSTLVYQIDGLQREADAAFLQTVSDAVNQGCTPMGTILLDVSPDVGLGRKRGHDINRYEDKDMAFHERVRQAYKKRIGEYANAHVIDANRSFEEVWTDVRNVVQSLL